MVVYDNMKMFDLAVELGAAINILNNQQLTPLSTASFLARTEMFFHIANLEREVYWQIGTFCVTLQFIIIYTNDLGSLPYPLYNISHCILYNSRQRYLFSISHCTTGQYRFKDRRAKHRFCFEFDCLRGKC